MQGRPGHSNDGPSFLFETLRPAQEKRACLAAMRKYGEEQKWLPGIVNEIELILEEWLTNVLSYGINASEKPFFTVKIVSENGRATIIVTDSGIPFDPTKQPPPDLTKPAEERPIGGLGIFMMKKLSSRMSYVRRGNFNTLSIHKTLSKPLLPGGTKT